jgi:hypothetical protein
LSRHSLIVFRRAALVLCVVAMLWTVLLDVAGGVSIEIGPLHASSRNTRNPTFLAVACLAAFGLLTRRLGGGASLDEEWSWWRRTFDPVVRPAIHVSRRAAPAVRSSIAFLPVFIALAGAAVDTYHWSRAAPFWVDEEMVAINLRDRSFGNLGGTLWLGQTAPYGWLVAERAVLLAAGTGERPLRAVPLLFGIATVAAAVWVGQRWFSRFGAILLVLICWVGTLFSQYRFEAKHYSADTFFGLLLPALAVWATEADTRTDRRRRAVVWWAVAAAGHWFAYGALFVIPACAICLFALVWRHDGWRDALRFATAGLIFLVSLGLHYQISIQDTQHSEFLRTYWQAELPPAGAGAAEMLRWLAGRLEPLAWHPGGTSGPNMFVGFWAVVIAGFVFGHRRFGAILASITLSLFVLAGMGILPLYERFALWTLPALYLGIAFLVERGLRLTLDGFVRGRSVPLAIGAFVAFTGLYITRDIVARGLRDHRVNTAVPGQWNLNDRDSVEWLMQYRRPGDAVAATRLSWPAIWWYGDLPLPNTDPATPSRQPEPAMYEIQHVTGGGCQQPSLGAAFAGHRRVVVYLGFRDVSDGFSELLLPALDSVGAVKAYGEFGRVSRAVVIDLEPNAVDSVIAKPWLKPDKATQVEGCIVIRPMQRW